MKNESKKHHYVPQSLLRGFAADKERTRVEAFDKLEGTVRPVAIATAGAENHFNTVTVDGIRHNVEGRFQGVDGRLATLLAKLREGRRLRVLTDGDRQDVAYLAALQLLRVKQQRTALIEFTRQLRETLESAGNSVSEDVLPSIDENTAKAMSLRTLQKAEKFVPAFLNKNWLLHSTGSHTPFWISDCPVVTVNIFPYGNTGLFSPGVEIAWPIASDLVLSFLCPSIAVKTEHANPLGGHLLRSEPTLESGPESVAFYNSLQVLQSLRFLYGPTQDFEFARRILRDNPDAKHVITRATVGKLGEPPPQPSLPPGKWLVLFGRRSHYHCRLESWTSREGRIEVVVVARDLAPFNHALADGPHEQIEIVDSEAGGTMMRMVNVIPDKTDKRRATIRHSDPSLDELVRQTTKATPPAPGAE